MENEGKPKKRLAHPDRITLNPESLKHLSGWLDDLSIKLKGIKLTRSDLVNWLIDYNGGQLSTAHIKSIHKKYFDEVAFHAWALREFKAAKARGDQITYNELINKGLPQNSAERKPVVKHSKKPAKTHEQEGVSSLTPPTQQSSFTK